MFIIRLFQKFSIDFEPLRRAYLPSQKVQELLGYLLLHRQHVNSREALAETLWGSDYHMQARKYLRKVLWQLQSDLKTVENGESLLLVDQSWLQISPHADLWLDVEIFEQAFQSVRGIHGRHLNVESFHNLEEAVRLYTGDLLSSWYQDWCLYERERYREMYLGLVDKLMAYCEANGLYEKGIDYGHILLSYDRVHERCHQHLMRLYYLSDDRTTALRQFEACKAALAEELDVAPSKRTLELYDQIARDELEIEPPSLALLADLSDHARLVEQVTASLQRIHNLLALQATIQYVLPIELQALEDTLRFSSP